jgi:hypothetical protein
MTFPSKPPHPTGRTTSASRTVALLALVVAILLMAGCGSADEPTVAFSPDAEPLDKLAAVIDLPASFDPDDIHEGEGAHVARMTVIAGAVHGDRASLGAEISEAVAAGDWTEHEETTAAGYTDRDQAPIRDWVGRDPNIELHLQLIMHDAHGQGELTAILVERD